MGLKRRKTSGSASTPEPKRRVTRSSTRTSTACAHNLPDGSPKAGTRTSKTPSAAERKEPSPTNAIPEVDEAPAEDGSPAPQVITTLTITHELVKKPIQCHQYTPSSPNSSPTLIFTHGAGGTLSADAVVNFCTGFSKYLPVLAFQGSMNLKARTKGFHACIEEIYSSQETAQKSKPKGQIKKKKMLLGGRSMGARAAVVAASELLAEQDHGKEDMSTQLILISYPLRGPKDDLRDQILLDLPESISVLFIIGDKDAMCPLDLLNETRAKMVAKSQVVVVRDADHGMNIKPASATKEVGESTGRVAAWWVEGDLKADVQYIGKQEE
jgi:predicted alpha/beta-hydrolase family hydrolase